MRLVQNKKGTEGTDRNSCITKSSAGWISVHLAVLLSQQRKIARNKRYSCELESTNFPSSFVQSHLKCHFVNIASGKKTFRKLFFSRTGSTQSVNWFSTTLQALELLHGCEGKNLFTVSWMRTQTVIQTTCTPCIAGRLRTFILRKVLSPISLETPDLTFVVDFLFIKQTHLLRGEIKFI